MMWWRVGGILGVPFLSAARGIPGGGPFGFLGHSAACAPAFFIAPPAIVAPVAQGGCEHALGTDGRRVVQHLLVDADELDRERLAPVGRDPGLLVLGQAQATGHLIEALVAPADIARAGELVVEHAAALLGIGVSGLEPVLAIRAPGQGMRCSGHMGITARFRNDETC